MSDILPVWYVGSWVGACLLSLVLAVVYRRGLPSPGAYAGFLLRPWKLVTGILATAVFVLAAPYSGDPTWDAKNSVIISALTFLTAPFASGMIFRAIRGRSPRPLAFVALCVGLLASCWSYDLYILAVQGRYPPSWASNLVLSGAIYLAAGLFWSLDWRAGIGIKFAFQHADWPSRSKAGGFKQILPVALLLMAFVALLVGLFVWDEAVRWMGI